MLTLIVEHPLKSETSWKSFSLIDSKKTDSGISIEAKSLFQVPALSKILRVCKLDDGYYYVTISI